MKTRMILAATLVGIGLASGVSQAAPGAGAEPDATVLTVTGSIKTHPAGYYLLSRCSHGTGAFSVTVEIDGERQELRAEPVLEQLADAAGKNPEGGEGMRYRFERPFRVLPGAHRVTVGIPEDAIEATATVVVPVDGGKLEFAPVYGPTQDLPGYYGGSHFMRGVSGLNLTLNGATLTCGEVRPPEG